MKGKKKIIVEVVVYVDLDDTEYLNPDHEYFMTEEEFVNSIAHGIYDAAEHMWHKNGAIEGYGIIDIGEGNNHKIEDL